MVDSSTVAVEERTLLDPGRLQLITIAIIELDSDPTISDNDDLSFDSFGQHTNSYTDIYTNLISTTSSIFIRFQLKFQ